MQKSIQSLNDSQLKAERKGIQSAQDQYFSRNESNLNFEKLKGIKDNYQEQSRYIFGKRKLSNQSNAPSEALSISHQSQSNNSTLYQRFSNMKKQRQLISSRQVDSFYPIQVIVDNKDLHDNSFEDYQDSTASRKLNTFRMDKLDTQQSAINQYDLLRRSLNDSNISKYNTSSQAYQSEQQYQSRVKSVRDLIKTYRVKQPFQIDPNISYTEIQQQND
ncbi:UNKNOWN [Stylonychia lemnae]|uniref:Uncharacterized protein n=1 Tax=Stylonychia lemnae TaxID=5949 RepID=A0A078AFL4_STYLE|nr:UNKNOWN [Stylonychia lemnae]|eukprot:CDW81010.1 UNKNOWN [Stylonychia lemnae]